MMFIQGMELQKAGSVIKPRNCPKNDYPLRYYIHCLYLHCSEGMPLSLQKELCNTAVNRNLFELS